MVTHSGYYCLLLQLDECGVQRCLYVKRHEHSDHESEQSAALFVAGIPIKLEDCLDEVFGAFGSVEQVHARLTDLKSAANVPRNTSSVQVQLHPRRTSAVIVFSQQNTVSKVLAAAKKGALVAFATNNQATDQHPTGLRKYVEVQKARCPGNDKLEQELNSWMVAFEESEERKRRALEAAAADDGWTLVTRKAGRKRKNGEAMIYIYVDNDAVVSGWLCFVSTLVARLVYGYVDITFTGLLMQLLMGTLGPIAADLFLTF